MAACVLAFGLAVAAVARAEVTRTLGDWPFLSEVGLRCLDGSMSGQFIELKLDGVIPVFDDSLRLRWYDRAGVRIGDMGHLFGPLAGTPWIAGRHWLLASPDYPSPPGTAPDGVLPDTLDTIAGRVELCRVDATGDWVLQTGSYGRITPIVPPGESVSFDEATGVPIIGMPSPLDYADQSLVAPGCSETPIVDHPWLEELFFRCRDGAPWPFVTLGTTGPYPRMDPRLSLRAFDHYGTRQFDFQRISGSSQDLPLVPGRPFLIGPGQLPDWIGLAPDRAFATALDSLGGRVELYLYDGTTTPQVVDSVRFGPGGVTMPAPGFSLARADRDTPWAAAPPAPSNQQGGHARSPECFEGCPTALLGPYGVEVETDRAVVDSVFTTSDCVIHFDMTRWTYRLENQSDIQLVDDFVIDGLPEGTPVSLVANLLVDQDADRGQWCWPGDEGCITTWEVAPHVLLASLDGGGTLVASGAQQLQVFQLPLSVVAGKPFRLKLDAGITDYGNPDYPAYAEGALRFTGLPAGATIGSCHGFTQDDVVPTLVDGARAEATPDHVSLEWRVAPSVGSLVRIQRREGSADGWLDLAALGPDGTGWIRYEDRDVVAGKDYAYRLAWEAPGGTVSGGELSVSIPPAWRLALLGARPNPAHGSTGIAYEVPRDGEVRLELFDVAGRRVRELRAHATAGDHVLTLRFDRDVPPGVYRLRLEYEGASATRSVIVTR